MNWTQTVAALLARLEQVQSQFELCYVGKTEALKSGVASKIQNCVREEAVLAKQLQDCHDERANILQRAKLVGIHAETLDELLAHQGLNSQQPLRKQLKQIEQRIAGLRQTGWVQWIISNCNYRHNNEMVELFARAGRSRLTYSETNSAELATASDAGGNLLDASI